METLLDKILDSDNGISDIGKKLLAAAEERKKKNYEDSEDVDEIAIISSLKECETTGDYLLIGIDSWVMMPEMFRGFLPKYFFSSVYHLPLSGFKASLKEYFHLLPSNTSIYIAKCKSCYHELFLFDCLTDGINLDPEMYSGIESKFFIEGLGSNKELVAG